MGGDGPPRGDSSLRVSLPGSRENACRLQR